MTVTTMRSGAWSVVAATLLAASAHAADALPFAAPVAPAMVSETGSLLRVPLALLLVLALLLGGAWLLKRLSIGQVSASQRIRILGQVSLGARERAVLVNVAGRDVLLGVAPGHVSTLLVSEGTVEQPVSVATDPRLAEMLRPTFKDILRRSLGR